MKRRSLLKGILGLAAAAPIAARLPNANAAPIPKESLRISSSGRIGLGVSEATHNVDPSDRDLVIRSEFTKELWPGINKWYKAHYDKWEADFERIF